MVIFHSYVKLPEGICSGLFLFGVPNCPSFGSPKFGVFNHPKFGVQKPTAHQPHFFSRNGWGSHHPQLLWFMALAKSMWFIRIVRGSCDLMTPDLESGPVERKDLKWSSVCSKTWAQRIDKLVNVGELTWIYGGYITPVGMGEYKHILNILYGAQK